MKIIGKAERGHIIQVSNNELCDLVGAEYDIDVEDKNGKIVSRHYDRFQIGDSAPISNIISKCKDIKKNWTETKKALSNFRSSVTKFENLTKEI